MTTEKLCPLCNASNQCGINEYNNSKEQCWCVSASITPALLARVPEALINKSCICQSCIDKYYAINVIDKY